MPKCADDVKNEIAMCNHIPTKESGIAMDMETLSLDGLHFALQNVAKEVVANEEYLTRLDTIIGDGDHGYGMRDGFTALQEMLQNNRYPNIYELLRACGIELLRTMGGASGVIFGTMFTGGHEVVKGKTQLTAADLTLYFEQGAKAIMKRGRSGPGDKTMVDALLGAVEAMRQKSSETNDVLEVLKAAAQGAQQGSEATKQMLPKTGRSKNFREQALGYPDPGSVSVSIIFKSLYEGVLCYSRS